MEGDHGISLRYLWRMLPGCISGTSAAWAAACRGCTQALDLGERQLGEIWKVTGAIERAASASRGGEEAGENHAGGSTRHRCSLPAATACSPAVAWKATISAGCCCPRAV